MKTWRINITFFAIIILGAVIISKLFFIQIINGDLYKALAQGQYVFTGEVFVERGEILFENGEHLAINMQWPMVYSSPSEIEEKEETANRVAGILNLNEASVLEDLRKDSLYVVMKKRLTKEEVEKIEEESLIGIYIGKERGRYYPQESTASQLVGFLGSENIGQYGVEGFHDELLRGTISDKGSSLTLTVDYSIQFEAEKLLKKAKEDLEIEAGEIIVMNPNTGEILALANFPSFNPNEYSKVGNLDVFQNSITQKIFEPGSVFKAITMAAAIDQGKITPSSTFIDPGVVKVGGFSIYNYEGRTYPGEISMTGVLEKSINTGAVFAGEQLGNDLFLKYIEKFGIFEPTGVDLDEIYSLNSEFKKGYDINFVTASFGQGIEMTSIQLVRAYSAIVNGGKLVKPYIIDKIDGVKQPDGSSGGKRIISQKTSSQLVAMLVNVVENGFAKSAQIPGYYVAGKTGTAQIAWSAIGINKRGYSDKTFQSFIGFAPAFNARFIILVKLQNPKTRTAEYSAVPIFHDLAKYIIDYKQILPDYE